MSVRYSAAALCAAAFLPLSAHAADASELAAMRQQIDALKADYEGRLGALESRLQALQQQLATRQPGTPSQAAAPAGTPAPAAIVTPLTPLTPATSAGAASTGADAVERTPAVAVAPGTGMASASAFNPAVSLILNGTYANLSRDPARYRLQGFIPSGGDVGPGQRSFSLGESELSLAASIDPTFSGRLTASITADERISVEEALFERQGLFDGASLKVGRFLSSIGYLNSQHAHAWDFADAPLAYQAFLGGPLRTDGIHLHWVAPTERYVELGAEIGAGRMFPGSDSGRNGVGSTALIAHVGDDIGDNASWRVGVSQLTARPRGRAYEDVNAASLPVTNAFDGTSRTWVLDGIYKWAPGGNATRTNFKLQGEYFRRRESGTLAYEVLGAAPVGSYRSTQSGWYLQAVYQFMPMWRAGVRYDRLDSAVPQIGLVDAGTLGGADFPVLQSARPTRTTLMVDYSLSEFSRLRLQVAADRSNPAVTDRQLFLQYIMSLGAHGAHAF